VTHYINNGKATRGQRHQSPEAAPRAVPGRTHCTVAIVKDDGDGDRNQQVQRERERLKMKYIYQDADTNIVTRALRHDR
jgi:hypothetical protein